MVRAPRPRAPQIVGPRVRGPVDQNAIRLAAALAFIRQGRSERNELRELAQFVAKGSSSAVARIAAEAILEIR
jgi:uncharacterized protein (DUF697 family)